MKGGKQGLQHRIVKTARTQKSGSSGHVFGPSGGCHSLSRSVGLWECRASGRTMWGFRALARRVAELWGFLSVCVCVRVCLRLSGFVV